MTWLPRGCGRTRKKHHTPIDVYLRSLEVVWKWFSDQARHTSGNSFSLLRHWDFTRRENIMTVTFDRYGYSFYSNYRIHGSALSSFFFPYAARTDNSFKMVDNQYDILYTTYNRIWYKKFCVTMTYHETVRRQQWQFPYQKYIAFSFGRICMNRECPISSITSTPAFYFINKTSDPLACLLCTIFLCQCNNDILHRKLLLKIWI